MNATALYVCGTTVSSSDNRLKFNDKILTNALDITSRLELVAYDQTQNLVESYTAEAPQSHECGFMAQSFLRFDELTYAVGGGMVGDDGQECIRDLNYNAI